MATGATEPAGRAFPWSEVIGVVGGGAVALYCLGALSRYAQLRGLGLDPALDVVWDTKTAITVAGAGTAAAATVIGTGIVALALALAVAGRTHTSDRRLKTMRILLWVVGVLAAVLAFANDRPRAATVLVLAVASVFRWGKWLARRFGPILTADNRVKVALSALLFVAFWIVAFDVARTWDDPDRLPRATVEDGGDCQIGGYLGRGGDGYLIVPPDAQQEIKTVKGDLTVGNSVRC